MARLLSGAHLAVHEARLRLPVSAVFDEEAAIAKYGAQ
jgi:hypothetical protein